MIRIFKRLFVYAFLVFVTALLVGVGFQTAEKGINALTGVDGPPKTIDVKNGPEAVQVTVMGKKVTQPKPTLGDQMSATMESTGSNMSSYLDSFAFKTGIALQQIAQFTIQWIATLAGGLVKIAMAFL